jgi:hypothetical protein
MPMGIEFRRIGSGVHDGNSFRQMIDSVHLKRDIRGRIWVPAGVADGVCVYCYVVAPGSGATADTAATRGPAAVRKHHQDAEQSRSSDSLSEPADRSTRGENQSKNEERRRQSSRHFEI